MNKQKYFSIAVVVLLSTGIAAPALSQTTVAEIRTVLSKNDFEGAIRAALKQATAPETKETDRAQLLRVANEAIIKRRSSLSADLIPLYQSAANDASLPNLTRLELLNQLSSIILSQQDGKEFRLMDTAPSRIPLADGLKVSGLLPEEKAVALTNIAKGWQREGDETKARDAYAQITKLDVPDTTKTTAWSNIAQSWARENNREQALRIVQEHQLEAADIYAALGDLSGQTAALEKILANPDIPEKERYAAFGRLLQFAWGRSRLLGNATFLGQKYFSEFQKTDPNRALSFSTLFRLINIQRDMPLNTNSPTVAEFMAWSGPLLLAAPRLSDRDRDSVRFRLPNALAILGHNKEAQAAFRETISDEKTAPRTRLWAQLLDVGLAQNNIAGLDKVLDATLRKSGTEITNEDQLWATREASRTAGYLNNIPLQRTLYQLSTSLLLPRETARITCQYLPTAPADVTSWLQSPLLKDAKNRGLLDQSYGDNLKFVQETDVNVRERSASDGKAEKTPGDLTTELYTACDDRGLFIFLNARDPQYREVLEKQVSGGGIEMYMAPGERQPYYFIYSDLANANSTPHGFVTSYPNEYYRALSREKGTYFFRSQPTSEGFGAVVFLSWELFADKLPSNGTRWQLEPIRWSRNGGFSFGGSTSVHNRSNFGEIEFQGLDTKAILAIKRRVVANAAANYRSLINIAAPVGKWADPDLGDPKFYAEAVKPEVDRLKPYADIVSATMSDTEVEKVFTEAVPAMRNLERRIAAKRTEYLNDRFAQDGSKIHASQ